MKNYEIQKLLDKDSVTSVVIYNNEDKFQYGSKKVFCVRVKDGKVTGVSNFGEGELRFYEHWHYWLWYALKHIEPEAEKLTPDDWVKKGIESFEKLNNYKLVFFTIPFYETTLTEDTTSPRLNES